MKRQRPRLTRRMDKLAQERLKDPAATSRELAARCGYSSGDQVRKAERTMGVKERIRELMERSPKLRAPALLKRLEEGLASKASVFATWEGEITDEKKVDDMKTRAKYLEMAFKLDGALEVDRGAAGPLPAGASFNTEAVDGIAVEKLERIVIERVTRLVAARKRGDQKRGDE